MHDTVVKIFVGILYSKNNFHLGPQMERLDEILKAHLSGVKLRNKYQQGSIHIGGISPNRKKHLTVVNWLENFTVFLRGISSLNWKYKATKKSSWSKPFLVTFKAHWSSQTWFFFIKSSNPKKRDDSFGHSQDFHSSFIPGIQHVSRYRFSPWGQVFGLLAALLTLLFWRSKTEVFVDRACIHQGH